VLLARGRELLEASADEIRRATGVRVLTVPTDLREMASVQASVDAARAEFGAVHILVNNAGGPIKRQERQITWPDSDWVDDVNTKTIGMLRITQALLPIMPTDGTGRIINISGIAGASVLRPRCYGLRQRGRDHVTRFGVIRQGPSR
jgi:NADP-dependent 3-hydroxy acid dehydrogenase YdfG